MNIIFDVRHQDLRYKARLVVGGHVVNYKEYTTYSYIVKYVFVRIMLLIAVKKWLGIMAGDIGNELYIVLCDENIWSFYGAEFDSRCCAAVVLKLSF